MLRALFIKESLSMFLQPSHLQSSEHFIPAWKHSQYFFKQPDFLQLQPFACRIAAAFLSAALCASIACFYINK